MAKEKKNNNDNKNFMKEFKAELKKVAWPTSKQMIGNVSAVIAIVLVTALVVFCLDLIFAGLNEYGINKLKNNIQTQSIQNNSNNEETNSNEENSVSNAENTQEPNDKSASDIDTSVNNDTEIQKNENVEDNNSSEKVAE